jgi:hypothetical protein
MKSFLPLVVERRRDVVVVRLAEKTTVDKEFSLHLAAAYRSEMESAGKPIKVMLICPSSVRYTFTFLLGARSKPFADLLHAHAIVLLHERRRNLIKAHKDLFPGSFPHGVFATETEAMAWLAQ